MIRRRYVGCRPLLALLLLLGALMASPALAQQTDAEKKAQAKAHYLRAKAAFDQGNYQDALFEYTKAYSILPLPGFLFNIGQCYRNMGYTREAIEAFELYIKKSPQAKNRKAVEVLIGELRTKEAASSTAGPQPPDTGQPETGDGRTEPTPGDTTTEPDTQPGPEAGGEPGDDQQGDKVPAYVDTTPPPDQPKEPGSTPIYKRWWFWTVVAAAAGGAAVGVYFGVRPRGAEIPSSSLGLVDFSR